MVRNANRWLRSKTGVRTIAGALALLVLVVVAGQALGWWPSVFGYLRGTAGTQGVYPSQVQLAYFQASAYGQQVMVTWQTEIETYNQGFNLYRAQQGDSVYSRVNDVLIPSQASEGVTSAAYEFLDASAAGGITYEYRIESIDQQSLPSYLASTTVLVPSVGTGPSTGLSTGAFLPFIRH